MRPIHLAVLDETRPVLVLTRELVRPHLARVTVAPITSTVRGLSTEVPVGAGNGLDPPSVVSCDDVLTIPTAALGRQIGRLLPEQEPHLTAALHAAFDLEDLMPFGAAR
jgi:mRNA interferase MazF